MGVELENVHWSVLIAVGGLVAVLGVGLVMQMMAYDYRLVSAEEPTAAGPGPRSGSVDPVNVSAMDSGEASRVTGMMNETVDELPAVLQGEEYVRYEGELYRVAEELVWRSAVGARLGGVLIVGGLAGVIAGLGRLSVQRYEERIEELMEE